jgi:hypothetical protein
MSEENDYEVTSEEESLPELPEQRDDTGDWKEQVEEDTEQHYWQYDTIIMLILKHIFMLTVK